MTEQDFGAYLATVHERDVDLLLMEEFHVSPNFTHWFAEKAGVGGTVFDGAWHSVTDADGETDLLLRVRRGDERIGILIENKVSAAEQDRQDERYHLRAARAQNAGRFGRFVTCICAPQAYLDGLAITSMYQAKVSYEEIEAWFDRSDDPRSNWRRHIMAEAIAQSRRGYKMIVNTAVSDFHKAFWRYLTANHPKFVMRRPTPKGNKSNWLLFKGADFPPGVGFHIKMDQRCVELGFNGKSTEDILAVRTEWPDEVQVVQKGKTAALAIQVPFLDRTKPLDEQSQALEAVMDAVAKLYSYAHLLGR